MNLEEKLKRSKNSEKINFTKIGCLEQDEALVKLKNSTQIVVEPIWTVNGDVEGSLYAEYRKKHPDYDGIYLRLEVVKRLQKAAQSLEKKYELIVRAGHRPLEVQEKVLRKCIEDFKNDNPNASDKDALEHARTFVSDPEIKLPPHNCGTAVDIDVRDVISGNLVDFGSSVNEDNESSFLHAEGLTHKQMQNRQMLLKAMLGAGFASCYSEWWHYSYGDQVWAWFYGKKDCLYGLVEV